MSCLENDKIQEAALEDFLDLYDTSRSFQNLVESLFTASEGFAIKELGVSEFEPASRVFRTLWDNDCELLVRDKRMAIEAYLAYRDSMAQLNRLLKEKK